MKTDDINPHLAVALPPVSLRAGPWRRPYPMLARLVWLAALGPLPPAFALDEVASGQPANTVNFEPEGGSADARHVADWIMDSRDNQGLPFVIVDKLDAKVYVFHADGRLRGAAQALLGLAVGDDSVPGIGQRVLSTIRPQERTTPAGRFVADLDKNLHGKPVLWIDYDLAISMHPVVTNKPSERRAERLASPSTLDNRISFGCINVPAHFFKTVVSPAFLNTNGIVYVLPETRTPQQVFASYDAAERTRLDGTRQRVRVATAVLGQ